MLNFVLCDDNSNILEKFSDMLSNIFINNNLDGKIVYTSSKPENILDYIKNNIVDVAILDIDFPSSITGIELANEIRKINKQIYIIFATGHLEFIISAYKCKTFDYLFKPISYTNLESTILRLFNDISSNEFNNSFITINNKKTIINANSIYYVEKDSNRVIFKSKDADYTTYSSFNKIKASLPSNFVRCHKSYIVNINNIKSIDNDIIYFNHQKSIQCYIGNIYKKNLMGVLKNGHN